MSSRAGPVQRARVPWPTEGHQAEGYAKDLFATMRLYMPEYGHMQAT